MSRKGPQALTPRERQVLEAIAAGQTNEAIADQLGISVHTVKTLRARILARLSVHTMVEAVAAYVRWQIAEGAA